MLLHTQLHGKTYAFSDIRLLMGKANEEKLSECLAAEGVVEMPLSIKRLIIIKEVMLSLTL